MNFSLLSRLGDEEYSNTWFKTAGIATPRNDYISPYIVL